MPLHKVKIGPIILKNMNSSNLFGIILKHNVREEDKKVLPRDAKIPPSGCW